MRRIAIVLGLVAGSLALTGPASADPACVGTDRTVTVCVDPTGGVLYTDCIYTGGSTCQPVTVPGPTVDCGGDLYDRLNINILEKPC